MTTTNAQKHYETWPAQIREFKKAAPDTMQGFHGLFAAAMREGAVSSMNKELIALAIGMALRCEPCIYSHVEKALKAGASREQIIEAAEVVIMMQGGPGYVYFPKVLEALEALAGSCS